MLLEAHHIKIYVKDRLLVEAPHLYIGANDRIGLVGRNGSGKTTLMEVLAGMKSPDEGMVTLRARCEFIPQLKRTDTTKSGGELTQEIIQNTLLKEPELLFADEPTTNLDTSHIEWLEKKLQNWQGAFVIVSHDRTFLDALCTSIWEIRDGKLNVYKGNYSKYAEQRELEDRQHDQAYEQYMQEKKRLERAIRLKEEKAERATKKPRKVSPSESKITGAKPYFAKKQKKMQKTAKALETRLEKLEKVEKRRELPPIRMNLLNEETFKGRITMRVNDLSGTIEKRILWQPVSFNVRGGDKLAIIGPNGCGKTTLVKSIIRPNEHVTLSPAVKIGYFSQNIDLLDINKSVLDNVRSTSSQDETLIRTVLARLHFFRDDVYKPVAVLSGGERVKVALAKLFVSDVNTLVLDEPTNFLDIETIEALESLLQEYEGTVLFVSHDRRFIKNIAKRILAFDHSRITVFEDSYEQFLTYVPPDTELKNREEQLLLLETKISDVLSRLSLEPSEELEKEFQLLLAEKRKLQST
ncbi:Vga family ABC-F type ribosomal protection protein [Brevibacillus sp. NL20B1]|jgi:pleuromutilin/lincosamide/streptogramin A transport system ATP-binding/permease protein|uniref:Vga family ABC-F type ribosomal protection protein n=1 Tax=Brevibacillus sp. NL20B1 TaxID=2829799 RepID=UPI001B90308C|nr:Vga family ABC-F type ribosomal protection protein [Brevibacillus sp. NL20B1]MBR8661046.1 Vga family ABC-F type ribosomal protection protein [Brevibacillus sp. NL20B1]